MKNGNATITENSVQAVLHIAFDEETDTFFRSLWQKVKGAGIPSPLLDRGATPHLTLSFGNEVNTKRLVPALSKILEDKPAPKLVFVSLATFSNDYGVLFFAPVVTSELLALHREVEREMSRHASSTNALYKAGRWVPHCTITMKLSPEQLLEGFKLLGDVQLPISAQGTRVRLLEFPSLKPLALWHLKGDSSKIPS